MGDTLSKMGEVNEGIDCFRKAIEMDPSDKDAYDKLSVLCLRKGM